MKKTIKKAPKSAVKKATRTASKKATKAAVKKTPKAVVKKAPKAAVKKAPKKDQGISRIEPMDGKTKGWYVRVYYRGKTCSSKFFSDKKFGGKNKALNASREYREKEIEALKTKHPDYDIACRRRVKTTHSNTGILGVSRVTYYDKRRNKYYDCYSVSWRPEPGQAKVTKFSINKYGEKLALKKACELRKLKEGEIYGSKKASRKK
jgi:hypothetical protein